MNSRILKATLFQLHPAKWCSPQGMADAILKYFNLCLSWLLCWQPTVFWNSGKRSSFIFSLRTARQRWSSSLEVYLPQLLKTLPTEEALSVQRTAGRNSYNSNVNSNCLFPAFYPCSPSLQIEPWVKQNA